MTDHSYSLLVLELSDVVARRTQTKPNLYVSISIVPSGERYEQLLRGRGPDWLRKNISCFREDLSCSNFTTSYEDAKKIAASKISLLRAQGFTVNRNTDLWTVYVIELDPRAVKNPGLGYVYVGETKKTPEQRFDEHISKATNNRTRLFSSVVARHGIRLRMDLAPKSPIFDRDASRQAESEWAEYLRSIGYTVAGGH